MTAKFDVTAGALALRRCGKTQSEIARLLGVSRQLVSVWWSGQNKPGPEHRARLETLGISLASQWEQDGSGRRKALPVAGIVPSAPTGPIDTGAKIDAQVVRLEALLLEERDLSASARVQVERALGQALAARAKLDGTQITESTIVRHPAHQRVMALVFSALEGFPEAARAVADVLKAAG